MSSHHPLHTWDATKQARWQQTQRQQQLVLHVLLDASGSMTPYAGNLRASYNMYLDFLQHSAAASAIMDTRCFGAHLQPRPDAPPLRRDSDRRSPSVLSRTPPGPTLETGDTRNALQGILRRFSGISPSRPADSSPRTRYLTSQ